MMLQKEDVMTNELNEWKMRRHRHFVLIQISNLKLKTKSQATAKRRAVPIPLIADYANTESEDSRLLEQPIPIIRPIMKPITGRVICEIRLIKLFVSET